VERFASLLLTRLAQVVTLADYDKYCYYVAGLVGVGLSRLFTACGASPYFLQPATPC
jgi:phytoene/squalene synthetase